MVGLVADLKTFSQLRSGFGLALGVITVMISLKNIADITADKKNGSIGMNILGLMVGGAMTAVSAILFAAGGATERIVTGKEL